MDEILAEFLTETSESMTEMDNLLIALEQNTEDGELITRIFRILHTIKGTCGFIGLPRLERLAHRSEDLLGYYREGEGRAGAAGVSLILSAMDRIKDIIAGIEQTGAETEGDDSAILAMLEAALAGDAAASGDIVAAVANVALSMERPSPARADESGLADQSLRVSVEVLENLMTMVSELVLTRNQLLQISRQSRDNAYGGPLQRLNLVVSDLQEGVMKTRMQPVGNAWAKLPRIVRDICHELGKKIDMDMHGQDTELDRQVLEMIKDPLTHMVRNAADHGIEAPADRALAGKPETGKITLRSYHQGGHIMIEISDDGRGLQTEKIKQKLLENRLVSAAELEGLSVQQIQQYVFHPGFSTAEKITAVSGRGVGMDVVRANIQKIGGSIEIRSVEGKGTHFTIKIPLTLAIVSALIVGVGEERFVIPQLSVSELVLIGGKSGNRIEMVNNAQVLRLRGNLLPLIDLETLMGLTREGGEGEARFVVVTRVAQFMFGIIVDKVYDLEEIVVKPVTRLLKDLPLFSGNTILGDGRVIMILDPAGILRMANITDSADSSRGLQDAVSEDVGRGDEVPLLLFRAEGGGLKAAPLHMVSRLEKIDVTKLEYADGRTVIQYQGSLMPVTSLGALPQKGVHPLIILKGERQDAGILVHEIIDITRYCGAVRDAGHEPVLDSVILNGEATDIINPGWYTQGAQHDAGRMLRMAAE